MLATAILISGSGSTAEAIITAVQSGKLVGIKPVVVVASSSDAGGIAKAKKLGIKTEVVSKSDYKGDAFGKRLLQVMDEFEVDLISQNGWLPLTPAILVAKYRGRIINQHPGPLDPGGKVDFGGKGMYGERVSCARLMYARVTGENWTESTVHQVSEEYDKGNLIQISRMEFGKTAKLTSLADLAKKPQALLAAVNREQVRLLPIEHKNVIKALKKIVKHKGRYEGFRRDKPLVPKKFETVAKEAKKLAVGLYEK